jgi:hypothetical protein
MGFTDVLLYHPGKMDWMSAGLPTEGEDTERLAGELLHANAPTCAPEERAGDLAARLDGWSWCAVLDGDGVVVGGIDRATIVEQPERSAFEVAEPGPQTYRASVPVSELVETLRQTGQDQAFVSDADGRFLGTVNRQDLEAGQGA